ncbi:MAG: electron transfer flavoprotein subunit alpha/FixB family protein [Anaerolineales bacterium]
MPSGIYVLIEHQQGAVEDISYVMLAAGNMLAKQTGEEIIALLLGNKIKEMAGDLKADQVIYFDHPDLEDFSPDAYLEVLAPYIEAHPPKAFIGGHTSVGMDIVCGLASRFGFPIISQCQKFKTEGETIRFVSQICGGKIIVEGLLPEPSVMISLVPGSYKVEQGKGDVSPDIETVEVAEILNNRMKLIEYVELDAGDVDISKEEVLVAVGRGLQNPNDLELAQELAGALGGSVCGSRPVIDQGWLPASRLVGKSGKSVSPKVYLAFGISGAPEHTQAITESDIIIAINTDPNAPIFEFAKYGVEEDAVDILTALNDHITQN